jgi:hypothetical protein
MTVLHGHLRVVRMLECGADYQKMNVARLSVELQEIALGN